MDQALAQAHLERLAAAAHHVIAYGGPNIGRTKLNKVLWFADCMSWRRRGFTVTGLREYTKLQYGPVPPGLDWAMQKLSTSGAIQNAPHYVGTYVRYGYISLRDPNATNEIGPDDRKYLDEIIAAVAPMTAFDVSELSHDALWHATPYGGKIPVSAASVQSVPPDERVVEWARGQRA